MDISEAVSLVLLIAIVAGVFLGRRKGKQAQAAAIADATAVGKAEARAELAATLSTNVQVINGDRSGSSSPEDEVLLAALRRIANNAGAAVELSDTGLAPLGRGEGEHAGLHDGADGWGTDELLALVHGQRSREPGRRGEVQSACFRSAGVACGCDRCSPAVVLEAGET